MKDNLDIGFLHECRKITGLLGMTIICLLLSQCSLFEPRRPIPDNLKQRIKNLCEQYPPPSDFVPFDEPRAITKSDGGTYGGWYSSSMNSNDVIAYYSNLLKNDNWTFEQEYSSKIFTKAETKYVTFEKDGFHIALEFANDEKIPVGDKRAYGLNCGFRP